MNEKGYLMLSRKFFSHKLWREARVFSECEAWLDLLQSARFEATEQIEYIGGREIRYGRGQYPASVRFLSKRWKWGERKVRVFLNMLKKDGSITVETEKQGMSIITICKYEDYNPLKKDKDTAKDTANDTVIDKILNELQELRTQVGTQQRTHEGHTKDTNSNKEEERNNNIPPINNPPEGKTKKFIPPQLEEVRKYCSDRNSAVDPSSFIDFYQSKGWMVGKNKMKDWKAAIRTWERTTVKNNKHPFTSYDNNTEYHEF